MSKNARYYTYTAMKRLGTKGREWVIVNGNSGCAEYFSGTKAQADRRAVEVTKEKTAAWIASGGIL